MNSVEMVLLGEERHRNDRYVVDFTEIAQINKTILSLHGCELVAGHCTLYMWRRLASMFCTASRNGFSALLL